VGSGSDTATQATYEEYVEKYGEDNAAYLMEALGAWRSHYDRAAYVDMGVAAPDAAGLAEDRARGDAERRGWQFDKLAGELILIRKLIDGDWAEDDMLVVTPGQQLAMSYDERVIKAVPAAGPEPDASPGPDAGSGPSVARSEPGVARAVEI
jgi:hypothetical protein